MPPPHPVAAPSLQWHQDFIRFVPMHGVCVAMQRWYNTMGTWYVMNPCIDGCNCGYRRFHPRQTSVVLRVPSLENWRRRVLCDMEESLKLFFWNVFTTWSFMYTLCYVTCCRPHTIPVTVGMWMWFFCVVNPPYLPQKHVKASAWRCIKVKHPLEKA